MEFNLVAESVQDRTARIQNIVEHFGSDVAAELYLSGRIDWYGNFIGCEDECW